jgi:hypothetical protein
LFFGQIPVRSIQQQASQPAANQPASSKPAANQPASSNQYAIEIDSSSESE